MVYYVHPVVMILVVWLLIGWVGARWDVGGSQAAVPLGSSHYSGRRRKPRGRIPAITERIIKELRVDGLKKSLGLELMKSWQRHFGEAAEDRNKLMHGVIGDLYSNPQDSSEPYRYLVRNFVRVQPQFQWLTLCLEDALDDLPDDQRIRF